MELSAKRGCEEKEEEVVLGLRRRVGNSVGTGRGGSAVREAMAGRSVRVGGGVVSPILPPEKVQESASVPTCPYVLWIKERETCIPPPEHQSRSTYQHPPGPSRRSNTRITSNTLSFANASTVMAPEGPAPITATRFAGMFLSSRIVFTSQNTTRTEKREEKRRGKKREKGFGLVYGMEGPSVSLHNVTPCQHLSPNRRWMRTYSCTVQCTFLKVPSPSSLTSRDPVICSTRLTQEISLLQRDDLHRKAGYCLSFSSVAGFPEGNRNNLGPNVYIERAKGTSEDKTPLGRPPGGDGVIACRDCSIRPPTEPPTTTVLGTVYILPISVHARLCIGAGDAIRLSVQVSKQSSRDCRTSTGHRNGQPCTCPERSKSKQASCDPTSSRRLAIPIHVLVGLRTIHVEKHPKTSHVANIALSLSHTVRTAFAPPSFQQTEGFIIHNVKQMQKKMRQAHLCTSTIS